MPGLVGYCVYTNQTAGTVTATATGDNGQLWKASKAGQSFSYTRPGGEKSNIGLDGTDTEIGTATFNTAPSSQTILLHVSDAAKCQALYGGDATTCFVLPGPKPGPICDAGTGNTGRLQRDPTDVADCAPPSLGFEATDERVRRRGDARHDRRAHVDDRGLPELRMCETSGHWNQRQLRDDPAGLCRAPSVPGGITANIYDPSDLTTPIASSTIDPDIPYRPSAGHGVSEQR